MLITTSTFAPTPLQRRSALGSAANYIMPKPFSEPGLPLPSSSRRRRDGRISSIVSSPRFRKRALVGVLCLVALFVFSSMSGNRITATDARAEIADRGRAQQKNNYERPRVPAATVTRHGPYGSGYEQELNAINEDSMLAENEIAVDNEVEEPPKTEAELKAEREKQKQKVLTRAQEKKNQIRALVRWLSKGGQLPESGYKAPSERDLKKMSGIEFEEYLMGLEDAFQPTPNPFLVQGWESKTAVEQGVTVFSKSYCPYSMNAKTILGDYPLNPAPYIIELDQRDDGSYLQDILKALTGRRTVPNVIASFESLGGSDEVSLLHHEGTLAKKLPTWSLIN